MAQVYQRLLEDAYVQLCAVHHDRRVSSAVWINGESYYIVTLNPSVTPTPPLLTQNDNNSHHESHEKLKSRVLLSNSRAVLQSGGYDRPHPLRKRSSGRRSDLWFGIIRWHDKHGECILSSPIWTTTLKGNKYVGVSFHTPRPPHRKPHTPCPHTSPCQMAVMPLVGMERVVFYRERAASYYSPWAYGLVMSLVELPYQLVQVRKWS